MTCAKYVESVTSLHVPVLELARSIGLGEHDALTSREDGSVFYEHLVKDLDTKLPQGGVLRLDFKDVWLMDASFADESIVKLGLGLARGAFQGRYLLLENLRKASYQNLVLAAESKHIRDPKSIRNMVLSVLHDGEVKVVGKLEDHLTAPLEQVRALKRVTARELALALSLEVATASTKLKTLYDLRLLRRDEIRDESGKQFSYTFFA